MSGQDLSARLLMVLVLELVLLSHCVQAGGHLSLRLLSYTHPSGQLASHQCCDSHQQQQQQQQPTCDPKLCDPYFVITIHDVNTFSKGFNMTFHTGTLRNTESVNFTDRIGNTLNPLNASFDYWPGAAEISVNIWDDNSEVPGSAGLITNLQVKHSQRMAVNDDTLYYPVAPLTDNVTTTILVEINLKCDEGCQDLNTCSRCCVPVNNTTGHIGCDNRGKAHCLPGWTGSPKLLCPDPICNPPCPAYSTCQAVRGHQTCVCQPGHSGADCQPPRTTSLTSKATTTSTTSKPTTSMTTTTTLMTTTATTAKPTTPSLAHKTKGSGDDCFLLVCYIFIPLICLLALTLIAIVVALIVYYVDKRKSKEKETKVEPFRSLDF